MCIGSYWEYLDVQVLVVCLSPMIFLILKLFSESQFIRLPLDYHFLSNKLICAIEQSWIMKSLIWKIWEEKNEICQL